MSRQDEEKQREEGRKAQTGERRTGQMKPLRGRQHGTGGGATPAPSHPPTNCPQRGGHHLGGLPEAEGRGEASEEQAENVFSQ